MNAHTRGICPSECFNKKLKAFFQEVTFRLIFGKWLKVKRDSGQWLVGERGHRIKVWFTRENNYIGKVLVIKLIVRTWVLFMCFHNICIKKPYVLKASNTK